MEHISSKTKLFECTYFTRALFARFCLVYLLILFGVLKRFSSSNYFYWGKCFMGNHIKKKKQKKKRKQFSFFTKHAIWSISIHWPFSFNLFTIFLIEWILELNLFIFFRDSYEERKKNEHTIGESLKIAILHFNQQHKSCVKWTVSHCNIAIKCCLNWNSLNEKPTIIHIEMSVKCKKTYVRLTNLKLLRYSSGCFLSNEAGKILNHEAWLQKKKHWIFSTSRNDGLKKIDL